MWLLLALTMLLVPRAGTSAQEQALTVDLASLTADDGAQAQAVVTVLDADGRTVPGLSQDHFQVQINGSAVPVSAATLGVDSTVGIAVVLALDVSNSMQGGALEQAKAAARGFLAGLGPQDSVAIVTFADTVDLVQPFTQDPAAAGAVIDGLTMRQGTALFEATAESVRLAAGSGSSRRVVVLLSDGLDLGSTISQADALTTAETLAVPIFAIGLGIDIDRAFLGNLAQVSGGRFTETPSPEGLTQLYGEVGELLRGQYVLTLDISGLTLAQSEAALLRVDVTAGERTASGEGTFAPRGPVITLSDLAPGERLETKRTVIAEVLSADAVVSVTFLVDGRSVLERTEPPYEFTFDPDSFAEGEHAIQAQVTTAAGATAMSEVPVRTGAGGGSGFTTPIAAAVVLLAGLGGVLLLLFMRRRQQGTGERPIAAVRQEPPPGLLDTAGLRLTGRPPPLWEKEQPPPPPPTVQKPLGTLIATSGPLAGQAFPIGDAPAAIGTGHRCLIRLPEEPGDEEIGPEHVRAWVRSDQLMVHELRRLTAMGGEGGRWSILGPGEAFTIGSSTFRFELAVDEAAAGGTRPASPEEIPNILRGSKDLPDGPPQESTSLSAEPTDQAETRPPPSDAPPTAEGNEPRGTVLGSSEPPPAQPEA